MKFRIKIIIGIVIVYLVFVMSRYSEFTTYIPLSGKIFNVDKENVTMVMIQNGNTGKTIYLKDKSEIDTYIHKLNNIKYSYFLPTIPLAKGGWSYRFVLKNGDESTSFECGEGWIKVRGFAYYITSNDAIELVLE